jgi:hypothetical protein
MNKISARKLVDVCCITLIILIFACKVSLKSLQVVPYSMPPIIFQYGLHPYINFGLQVVIAVILFAYWIKNRRNIPMNGFYKIFIFSLIAVLSIQTFFQIAFVNVQYSPLVQLGGLGMAIALILIYGLILPAVFPLEKLIYWICQTSTFICVAGMNTDNGVMSKFNESSQVKILQEENQELDIELQTYMNYLRNFESQKTGLVPFQYEIQKMNASHDLEYKVYASLNESLARIGLQKTYVKNKIEILEKERYAHVRSSPGIIIMMLLALLISQVIGMFSIYIYELFQPSEVKFIAREEV